VIDGTTLPDGWLGKNHACHQLAKYAKGDYYLFLDSDVRVRDGLVRRSMGHLQKYGLSMLSIFPRQLMHTFGEKITVPLINWVLVSLLPLRLIRISKMPCFSAANGQFILFNAATYKEYGFHELVKDRRVEDIHIVRKMKQLDLRVHTLLSSGEVECRMYNGFGDAVSGLSRSVEEFFCGSKIFLFLFTLYSSVGFLFVWLGLSTGWMLLYLVQTWLLRMLVAYSGRQSLFWNAILQPLQQFSYVLIVIESLRKRYTNTFRWKGRVIHTGQH
jgi:chlorobactene glucosyltransferase